VGKSCKALFLLLLNLGLFVGCWCNAQAEVDNPIKPADDATYVVSRFLVAYAPRDVPPHPDLPPLQELLETPILLGKRGDLYVGPGEGALTQVKLGEFQGPSRFSSNALVSISTSLAGMVLKHEFAGVWATPAIDDIAANGRDDRQGRQELRLNIYVAEAKQVRTVAKGRRIRADLAITNAAHERILANSPIQGATNERRGSLINKRRLDAYIGRLNRFPSRTVESALSSTEEPGAVVLDYLVSEDKPWLAYTQVANTGTEATGEWRERFGFIHQQLTSRDDILSLDYITSNFDRSHAFFGSYEIPLVFPDYLKARTYGSYGNFRADQLGVPFGNLNGTVGVAGFEGIWSPIGLPGFSVGRMVFAPTYLDFTAGGKWKGIEVDNEVYGTKAETDLALPYVGVSFSSLSQRTKLAGGVQLEGNLAGLADTEASDALGRTDTDREWAVVKWGGGFSFFLEPLIAPKSTQLAHELAFSVRGQYTLDNRRLIPEEEELIGGFYSVRGYPEAFDAGDTMYVATAEYRCYLGRIIKPTREMNVAVGSKVSSHSQFGNPFRFRPKETYGRPDWDLILRVFADGGQLFHNRPVPTETDRSVASTGVGLELQIKRNLNLRVDYGFVLRSETENLDDPIDSGDSRVHFSGTLAW
jgi:hemolysin activation/secretion protein